MPCHNSGIVQGKHAPLAASRQCIGPVLAGVERALARCRPIFQHLNGQRGAHECLAHRMRGIACAHRGNRCTGLDETAQRGNLRRR